MTAAGHRQIPPSAAALQLILEQNECCQRGILASITRENSHGSSMGTTDKLKTEKFSAQCRIWELTSLSSLSVQLPRSAMIALLLASRRVRAGMTHGSTSTSGSSTVTS
jgi:hypothetical protein